MPPKDGYYVLSLSDITMRTQTKEEAETQQSGLCLWVCAAPTCLWGVTVQRVGVLVHDVNQDDNQVGQADWI